MKLIEWLVTVLSSMWSAFVLSNLWFWFVVPLGVPPITWVHAWGLWLVPSMLLPGVGIAIMLICGEDDVAERYKSKLLGIVIPTGLAAAYAVYLLTGYLLWLWGMPH